MGDERSYQTQVIYIREKDTKKDIWPYREFR